MTTQQDQSGKAPDTLSIIDRAHQKSEQAHERAADRVEQEREEAEPVGIEALDDSDALDLLLSCEPAEQVQTVALEPRKGTDKDLILTLRSITESEWESIKDESEIRPTSQNRAQRRQRRTQGEETQTNNALMARLLVKTATTNFNWSDAGLRKKFNVVSGEDVIRKVLLYGEVANLAGIVMELSGFDDELIQFVSDSSGAAEKLGS